MTPKEFKTKVAEIAKNLNKTIDVSQLNDTSIESKDFLPLLDGLAHYLEKDSNITNITLSNLKDVGDKYEVKIGGTHYAQLITDMVNYYGEKYNAKVKDQTIDQLEMSKNPKKEAKPGENQAQADKQEELKTQLFGKFANVTGLKSQLGSLTRLAGAADPNITPTTPSVQTEQEIKRIRQIINNNKN